MRWVLEGVWSGYSSSQRQVCHRQVTTSKRYADRWKTLHGIEYTDGTILTLTVRQARPREKIQVNLSYETLISDCIHEGLVPWGSVEKLSAIRKAREAGKALNEYLKAKSQEAAEPRSPSTEADKAEVPF